MDTSRVGLIGLATGALGALSAVVVLVWPPQAPAGIVSYPFTTTGFVVAQGWFFIHHFGLVVLLLALAGSSAVGTARVARGGAWLATIAMLGLTFTELLAMRYAEWTDTAANEGLMGAAYGVSVTAIGVGMILSGIGVVRTRAWSGWHRWTPLAVGIAVFAVVTPGMFGGFATARLVIGFWMLLFGALGWSLYAESHDVAPQQARLAAA